MRGGVDASDVRRAGDAVKNAAPDVVVVSKSPWLPSIRREHALSEQALAHGLDVAFVEQPLDIRALTTAGRRAWLRNLAHPTQRLALAKLRIVRRSTVLPGHRGALGLAVESRILSSHLAQLRLGPQSSAVITAPWYWPAVAGSSAGRKVVDLADDWAHLLPTRTGLCRDLYRRIADEADAIIVAAPSLQELFPGRRVDVVRNATDDAFVAAHSVARPGERLLAAVGTLSERFDDELAGALLDRLPGWRLRLYGELRYPGRSGVASDGLRRLLERPDGRASWHGVVARPGLADAIDASDVLLLAHRSPFTAGQDSMKLYDYAARGRPVVCSPTGLPVIRPPHLYLGADASQLATAVQSAYLEDDTRPTERLAWARANAWSARWPAWISAVSARA